ncbi:DUF1707 domain-containing protein [Nocardioides sp.]|uniref:DUF1707 SHOCT-like domain-containing protein n=1 Tax=Nocardioides sp. TaxID=35761 RepID=UPI0027344906|nr:DUF1707 domain-containing protein [Nocardioides sp.]MDP3891426.1 DUF1707 domain-containing protein [Nocardioides sp.]
MPGPNPHERAKDGDRERVVKQLDAAYAAGRLTAADRDVRVRNARNSATHGELAMLTRDLQAPDAPREFFPPRPQAPAPPPQQQAGFQPPAQRPPQQQHQTITMTAGTAGGGGGGGAGKAATAVIVFIALLVMGVGAAVFMLVGSVSDSIDDWSDGITDPFVEEAIGDGAVPSPLVDDAGGDGGSGSGGDAAAPRYALDQPGLSGFVKAYRKEFGTTRVLGATLQQDQAVFDVPVKGKARHQSWYYRDGEFSSLGDVRANMPGAREVDLADVRIGKLVENFKVARRTLNVEKPDTMYVIVRHHSLQEAPELGIYLSNKFRESGYLATTLGGKVIRTHPHQTR